MREVKRHTLALGGVGGDSHSVGLNILRQAFTLNGYDVLYLGTQNKLRAFFEVASSVNAVLVSTMDGHARQYLRDFPELMREFRPEQTRWYLGGNLAIDEGLGVERYFMEMGFDRVFVKFVDVRTVLEILERELGPVPVKPIPEFVRNHVANIGAISGTPPDDEKLEFMPNMPVRRDVLDHWRTGRAATDLDANAEYLGRQSMFSTAQRAVNQRQSPILVQPRSGVGLVNDQIKLFQAFASAGATTLSYQVDSLTRNNNYTGVEEALRESKASGVSVLNGFPVVNHGVDGLRRVKAEVSTPLQTRHSTRDPRLLAEISYAGGTTAYEGGAICYNIPYYKDYPLPEAIRNWQYVDRLTGCYYEKYGIVIDREFFGVLTATLITPSLAISTGILESLLACQQGVKCVSIGYAEQGNRSQDIAAIRSITRLGRKYLDNAGFKDVQVNAIFHQYMAAFPGVLGQAEELIRNSATSAGLSGATRMLIKTPVEAIKIPTIADNLQAIALVYRGLVQAQTTQADEAAIQAEEVMIDHEVEQIIDAVIFAGGGRVAKGIVEGFRRGLIDVPFSPSIYNQGRVMTARDATYAVRYLNTGNLPLDRHVKQFHHDRLQDRRTRDHMQGEREDYLLIEHDVMQVARSQYESWPLRA